MERLWSYLRRFGRMTKEMRPSHRTDVLVHALLCYGKKTKAKLGILLSALSVRLIIACIGNLLVTRWKRTESIYTASIETFSKLAETHDGECMHFVYALFVLSAQEAE